MLVNFERRICFLAHARTASRATVGVLKERCGFVQVTDHHEGIIGNTDGLNPLDLFYWQAQNPREFLYLMTIRNPWDVIASWWVDSANQIRFPRIGPEWFEAFRTLHPKLFPKNDLWPYLENEPPGRSIAFRYEELGIHLATAAFLLKFPFPGVLPVIGRTENRNPDYRTDDDKESRDWVRETFPNAIKAGGYEF